ncbi:MAG: peptidoglycan-associated lipoprotein Pal [Nitrospinaceae bacterium]|nr:peptidoglycan-associated lipoprotein Pal [Nitrospinaceae bacterium]
MKRKFFGLMILVIGLSLTSACSKNLMPPEGQVADSVTESGVSETASAGIDSDSVTESGVSETASAGIDSDSFDRSGDSGLGNDIITESGSSDGSDSAGGSGTGSRPGDMAGSGSRDFGSGSGIEMPGDGYTGHGGGSGIGMLGDGHTGHGVGDPLPGDMAGTGSRDFGSGSGLGMPGDGHTGHGVGDPFSGGSDGSGSVDGSKSVPVPHKEARLQKYSPTSDLNDIHFKFDQYDLDDDSRSVLRKNASYLKANPMAKIEVQGHCDERGTNNYNIALGERRAQSTKRYLVSQGVNASRIHTISYGEEKPFCFDRNENCWLENRRAHFMIGK